MSTDQSSRRLYTVNPSSRLTDHALSFSSSSSTSIFSNTAVDIDETGFAQSKHRAGGPYLCALPAISGVIDHKYPYARLLQQHRITLEDTVARILHKREFIFENVRVVGRRSKAPAEVRSVTILITIHQTSRDGWVEDWRSMAQKVFSYVALIFPSISVEIIEKELDKPFLCHSIREADSIASKWDEIRMAILAELNLEYWTGLECWRFGTSPDASNNPVTVIPSVERRSTRDHQQDSQWITNILSRFGEGNVNVLFMRDEHRLYHTRPLEKGDCTQHLQPGVSIGIHESSAGSSTLGGLVELRFPGSNQWHQFGMTCFHAVYAPENHRRGLHGISGSQEAFSSWEFDPVKFNDPMARLLLKVDQPSYHDLEHAVHRAETLKMNAMDKDFQELKTRTESSDEDATPLTRAEQNRLKLKKRYISSLEGQEKHFRTFIAKAEYYLGHVVSGSGLHRTRQHTRIKSADCPSVVDWAIIHIDEKRMGVNKPAYANSQELVPEISFSDPLEDDPDSVDRLWISGRSTGLTSGDYKHLYQAIITRERGPNGEVATKVTHEHMVSAARGTFGEPGDSGAFVYGRYGGAIGVLLGGFELKGTAYFTHINNIFHDIREVTGAEDVRIAGGSE